MQCYFKNYITPLCIVNQRKNPIEHKYIRTTQYVGFWTLFFGSVNRAYLRFRDHIGIGKKMGDKKGMGNGFGQCPFFEKKQVLKAYYILYYSITVCLFFLIQRARGDIRYSNGTLKTVLWIIFPEASVFSDLNSDRNYFKESRKQCTPVEFCSNSNWNSNYKSKWIVSAIEGFQTLYVTVSLLLQFSFFSAGKR